LNLSNPGDYPLDDYEESDFEIIEIDDWISKAEEGYEKIS
jgi:hypothetical protein